MRIFLLTNLFANVSFFRAKSTLKYPTMPKVHMIKISNVHIKIKCDIKPEIFCPLLLSVEYVCHCTEHAH